MGLEEISKLPVQQLLLYAYVHLIRKGFKDEQVLLPLAAKSRKVIDPAAHPATGIPLSELDIVHYRLLLIAFSKIFGGRARKQITELINTSGTSDLYLSFYGEEAFPDGLWGFSLRGNNLNVNLTFSGDEIAITPIVLREVIDRSSFNNGWPPKETILLPEYGIARDLISLLQETPDLLAFLHVQETFKPADVLLFQDDLQIPDYGLKYVTLNKENQQQFLEMVFSLYADRINASWYPEMSERWNRFSADTASIFFRGDYNSSTWSYVVYTDELVAEFFAMQDQDQGIVLTSVTRDLKFDFGGGMVG